MTTHDEFLNTGQPEDADREPAPLDAWTASLVKDAMHVDDAAIPREMMWARIRQQRSAAPAATASVARPLDAKPATQTAGATGGLRGRASVFVAIAATLAIGVAIGRYGTPGAMPNGLTGAPAVAVSGTVGAGVAAGAEAQAARATDPAVVAMEEHFARTVALLTTVRDGSPSASPGADVSGWARELLGTTRMLLDEPQLRDDRTRRLLQDLELVLVQIIQARGTAAPEAQRAPSETMRETNLLPRVRAIVTASVALEEKPYRGIAE